jgi:hypothetical protein
MAVNQLAALIGDWAVEVLRPDTSSDPIAARQRFEWILGGQFVRLHWTIEHPDFPDAMVIMRADAYHYFDSRGVARNYRMSLADGVWTLQREDPDFWQRFTGRFGADGTTITGDWEMSHDNGATWRHDFTMTYRKTG